MSNEQQGPGGIYIILNLTGELTGKDEEQFARQTESCGFTYSQGHPFAYVGQAEVFSKRPHLDNLANGTDSSKGLQQSFDRGDMLVFFPIHMVEHADSKETDQYMNALERLCMRLVNGYGYNLYNIKGGKGKGSNWDCILCGKEDCKKEDIDVQNCEERLLLPIEMNDPEKRRIILEECRASLEKQFVARFGKGPAELAQLSREERLSRLHYYEENRQNREIAADLSLLGPDYFIFSREHVKRTMQANRPADQETEVSLEALERNGCLDELFFSKVGNYIGDGLDQILGYESRAIAEHGYCLWTFANNAIACKTIYRNYKKWAKQDKGVYALLTMTFSQEASVGQKSRYPVLGKKVASKIKKAFAGKTDAFFRELDEVQNGHLVSEDIDVTAKGDEPTCEAFVIEQLYLLDRTYLPKVVADYYDAVRHDDTLYIKRIDSKNTRRASFFMRRKESVAGEFWKAGTEGGSRKMSFLAKLAPPYVVVLSKDDPLKEE